jgi:hypothetical protein
MRKVLLGLLIVLIPTPAFANCPSGNCEVEVNCTTGVVTYRDAPPQITVPQTPLIPVAPISMVKVETANESFGASGSTEGVTQALQDAIKRSSNPEFIAVAEQAVIEPYKPEPAYMHQPVVNSEPVKEPAPLSAFEAYALIDFNAEDWLDQLFTWWEIFFPYEFTWEG